MLNKKLLIIAVSLFFVGCASVPKASVERAKQVKQLQAPSAGNAGVYLYRSDSVAGVSLKKDLWIDGKCVGETARGVFFYEEVAGDKEHTISTESEFSPNNLVMKLDAGKQYFFEQYIKIGVFVGGANLRQVDDATGKKAIQEYDLAESGHCSGQLTK